MRVRAQPRSAKHEAAPPSARFDPLVALDTRLLASKLQIWAFSAHGPAEDAAGDRRCDRLREGDAPGETKRVTADATAYV